MGEVVELPKPRREERAVTCGCKGQTFILVVDDRDQPDFVYCAECQHKIATVSWDWSPPPPTVA